MRGICRVFATALFTASAVLPKSAGAQDLLSGHIGVATPIVTFTGSNGTSNTTTIGNNFNIAISIRHRRAASEFASDFRFRVRSPKSILPPALTPCPSTRACFCRCKMAGPLGCGPHSRSIRTLLVLHRSCTRTSRYFRAQDSVGSWKATCRCGSFGYQMGPTPPLWASSCIQVWRSELEGAAITPACCRTR